MELDDELCLCFHVTKRKVINYIRVEKPSRPGQLSDCYGAGTGCGWCRAYLRRLFDEQRGLSAGASADPTPEEYARGRTRYVLSGGGTPPRGATPIDADPKPGSGRRDSGPTPS
jgi:bacterioferritin-associated ferredoxin